MIVPKQTEKFYLSNNITLWKFCFKNVPKLYKKNSRKIESLKPGPHDLQEICETCLQHKNMREMKRV